MSQSIICVIVFVLTILAYILNKWPLALVSMGSWLVLTVTGCLSPSDALAGFANSGTITMGATFIIAAGLNRTQMIHKVSNLVYKVSGGSFVKGMIGYCLVTFCVAQVIPSAILIISLCYPLVADFCRKMKVSISKGMFSIGLVAIATVTALPIGGGATTYISMNEQIAAYGMEPTMGMFDMCIARIPVLIIALVCAIWICPKLAPDRDVENDDLKLRTIKETEPLSPFREFCGYGIFVLVVVAILLNDYLPIETWQICAIGAILEIVTGVLTEKEALQSLNMSPIFLYIGSLGLGAAMMNSGAGELIGNLIQKLLGNNPSPLFVYVLVLATAFLVTQVMSNIALFNALKPVVFMLCVTYGWNPVGLLALTWVGCFMSYLSPLSTISIPFLMDVGGYNQRDLLKMGWIPAVLIIVTVVPWVLFMFPPV